MDAGVTTYQRLKSSAKTARIVSFCVLVAAAVFTLFPFAWVVIGSFKDNVDIFERPFGLPRVWHAQNYVDAWTVGKIGAYFLNSLLVSVVSVVGAALFAAMASFALARFRFKLNFLVYSFFIMGLMIPWASNLLPLFLLLKRLALNNTLAALILPYVSFELPMGILITTSFLKSMPGELEEAAIIDGCSSWGVFWKVVAPLAQPALATVAVLTFLDVWNEYLFALVFLNNPAVFTLPLGLALFRTAKVQHYGLVMAGVVISIIPVMAIYVCLQKFVIRGITAGAVKS